MTIETPADNDIAALALARRAGWPAELRVLIERFPREIWQGHSNLGAMARFWLSRHDMFRELAAAIDGAAIRFRNGQIPAAEFPPWFVPRLQFFLQQLNAHHHIEDGHYFPIFRAADARLARGFAVLEADHAALHDDIARTVATANVMLSALGGDADALRRAGDDYARASGALFKGLIHHLDDEEDLIVPLILDRGEASLGVAHG